uniref:Uncharacterized protein n=1 Tax=Naja naja TaxID=35670 RepID=A0A8C6VCZ2_NAJNA
MATSGEKTALGELSQEATCPLCLDFFKQPMGLSCGHNFCHDCLAQLGAEFSCPQCRAKVEPSSACPNRALANVVCLVKRLRLSEGAQEESSSQRLCQEHGQPLQSFCSREKSLLCPACLEGHQGHPLLSLPEAAQQYKDLLDSLLVHLREEEKELLEQRQANEQSRQQCQVGLLGRGQEAVPQGCWFYSWEICPLSLSPPSSSAPQEKFADEKQKVGRALEFLQELLRERQPVWLDWLAEQEEKIETEWGVALAQLSREASRLQ